MQAELLKVIEANLPAEVGKTLQKRLEEAEKESLELKSATVEIKNLKKLLTEAQEMIVKFEGREQMVLDQANANDQKEKALNKREALLDKSNSELKASEAEKRADQLKEVLGGEQNQGQYTTDYNNGQNITKATNFPSSKETHEEITKETHEEITNE